MQPTTPSTNSVIHADGRCPMPVDPSQGLALSMAKESLCWLIVPPSVLPHGGRIKDFSVQWIFGNDRASAPTKALHKPHPPIWIGANADPVIRRAARLGDCWYVNPHNRTDTIVRQVEVYKRALDEYQKPFPAEFPARREVFVARSRAEALRLCTPYLAAKYKAYNQWGQGKAMPEGENTLEVDFDDLIRDHFLLGGGAG